MVPAAHPHPEIPKVPPWAVSLFALLPTSATHGSWLRRSPPFVRLRRSSPEFSNKRETGRSLWSRYARKKQLCFYGDRRSVHGTHFKMGSVDRA